MAHSRGEIRVQEALLKNAMKSADVRAEWIFRKFGQHSELIADMAEADVALTTRASAQVNFPNWTWVPLQGKDASGQDLCVRTWASWSPRPEPEVLDVLSRLLND